MSDQNWAASATSLPSSNGQLNFLAIHSEFAYEETVVTRKGAAPRAVHQVLHGLQGALLQLSDTYNQLLP